MLGANGATLTNCQNQSKMKKHTTLLAFLRKYNIEEDAIFKIEVLHNYETNKFEAICHKTGSKFTAFDELSAITLLKNQITNKHNSFAIIEPFKGSEKLMSIYDCGRLIVKQKWVM